jgi:hypothetical protein
LATGVGDTVGKFAANVVDTSGNLPLASLTPVANLPPVSTRPAELVAKFTSGMKVAPRIFEKIRKDPSVIFRGFGEDDS